MILQLRYLQAKQPTIITSDNLKEMNEFSFYQVVCCVHKSLFMAIQENNVVTTAASCKDVLFLLSQEDSNLHELSFIENYGWGDLGETGNISCSDDMQCDNSFGIDPFYIEKGKLYESYVVFLFR